MGISIELLKESNEEKISKAQNGINTELNIINPTCEELEKAFNVTSLTLLEIRFVQKIYDNGHS